MIKFIKRYFQKRKLKKLLIYCELQRLKEDFVYKFLLNNYEKELRGKVDFGAWWYASQDMEQIKMSGKLNKAYTYAKNVLDKRCKESIAPWKK